MADNTPEDVPEDDEIYDEEPLDYDSQLVANYFEDPDDPEAIAEAVVYFSDGQSGSFEDVLNDLQRTVAEHRRFQDNPEDYLEDEEY